MGVFFVISGIFFKTDGQTFKDVLRKGFIQLIIPYLAFSIIGLASCWVSPYLHPELYHGLDSIPKILKAAFLGIFVGQDYYNGFSFLPIGALWFLLALFWSRILMYMWVSAGNRLLKTLVRIGIATIIVAIIVWHPLILSLDGMAVSFPFFMAGYYGKDFFKSLAGWKVQIRIIAIIVFAAILCLIMDSRVTFGCGRIEGNIPLAYIRSMSGVMVVLIASTFIHKIPGISTAMSFLGASTLTVLGFHTQMIIPSKVIYVMGFGGDPGDVHLVYALIVTLLIVCCLTFVHGFLSKKTPFIVGKGIARRRRAATATA